MGWVLNQQDHKTVSNINPFRGKGMHP